MAAPAKAATTGNWHPETPHGGMPPRTRPAARTMRDQAELVATGVPRLARRPPESDAVSGRRTARASGVSRLLDAGLQPSCRTPRACARDHAAWPAGSLPSPPAGCGPCGRAGAVVDAVVAPRRGRSGRGDAPGDAVRAAVLSRNAWRAARPLLSLLQLPLFGCIVLPTRVVDVPLRDAPLDLLGDRERVVEHCDWRTLNI